MIKKKYQPERTDLLINTDWGIPAGSLSAEDAKSKKLKLFNGRWVNQKEKKQLKDEHAAYQSVRSSGVLLIIIGLLAVINIFFLPGGFHKENFPLIFLELIYSLLFFTAGVGLMKFRIYARNIALFLFLSCLVLPFTPFLADEKGSPLLILLGIAGFYYLLRRPARKIFASPATNNEDREKQKRFVVRKVAYVVLLLLVFCATTYTAYGLIQARRMAADVCRRAATGMTLDHFLAQLHPDDYRIIKGKYYIMVVPKKGMGRSSCTISHNGQKIIEAKTGFND